MAYSILSWAFMSPVGREGASGTATGTMWNRYLVSECFHLFPFCAPHDLNPPTIIFLWTAVVTFRCRLFGCGGMSDLNVSKRFTGAVDAEQQRLNFLWPLLLFKPHDKILKVFLYPFIFYFICKITQRSSLISQWVSQQNLSSARF